LHRYVVSILRLKCAGTRAETRFGLSAKRTSPFKSAEASVQSTAGSRGVRISGGNSGYTKFLGSVKRCEGDWLPTPFASFFFTSPTVRHRVPSRFNWTLSRLFKTYELLVTSIISNTSPQQVLWAGSRAARVKISISCIAGRPIYSYHFCSVYVT